MKREEDEKDNKADGEKGKLEGAPGSGDDLLAQTDPDVRVLPVLKPLVDHKNDMENGGDKADDHQVVVLFA